MTYDDIHVPFKPYRLHPRGKNCTNILDYHMTQMIDPVNPVIY